MTHDPIEHDQFDEYDRPGRRDRRRDRSHPTSSRRPGSRREDLEGPRPSDAGILVDGTPDSDTPDSGTPDSGTDAPLDGTEVAWSTWLDAVHGPEPFPAWVVTDLGAIDTELGLLKTGKEADVHLVERAVPGSRGCLLAAKRYRSSEHRMFHRDAGYLEGRRVRRSRETRAMATRTRFGRDLLAGQWAFAEFMALSRLWQLGGVRVPYPVQLRGTELMLEFIGDADGVAAPRLAQLRPDDDELAGLWEQLVEGLRALAAEGLAHGDLSPYNVLVHDGQVVLIDLPQIVDVVANPQGVSFLARDVAVLAAWFTARGLPGAVTDPGRLTADLLAVAGL